MAPEQARGDDVDFRADVYALGVTLHHLVAGQPPFTGPTPMSVVSKHLSEPRPRLEVTRAATMLDAVCDRMMAKRPDDRPKSYDELIDVLEEISPERTRPAGLMARGFALLVDFLLLAIVGGVLGLALGSHGDGTFMLLYGAPVYAIVAHARWGKTLGKAALEIEVAARGRRGGLGLRTAVLRFALAWGPTYAMVGVGTFLQWLLPAGKVRTASGVALGLLGCLTPIVAALTGLRVEGKRPYWDRLAGTRVVYERPHGSTGKRAASDHPSRPS
jgi:hypothetical protein